MGAEKWFESDTPESQGIPSQTILDFIEEAEKERIGIDALILMRHKKIVAEGYWAPFEQGDPHRLFSAAKAFTATAVLFAIEEGLLHLEDKVTELCRESLPKEYSDKFDRMTLYHLLTMNTGHVKDTMEAMIRGGGDREKTFFALAPEKEPGTHFLYNNGVPDMLGIILYKVTGKRVLEYLEDRLFIPLDMRGMNAERYRHLDELPTMTATTRALFKLAYFYSNHGAWEGKQLLRADLADLAGAYLVPSLQDPEPPLAAYDTKFGYGFQIWRNSVGGFRIDGGRGQFGIVIPEMDLVAAINATEQDQEVLPVLFWKHITNRLYAKPLQEDPETYGKLDCRLKSLTWAEKGEKKPSPEIYGKYRFRQSVHGTRWLELTEQEGQIGLQTELTHGGYVMLGACNDGQWHSVKMPFELTAGPQQHGFGRDSICGADNSRLFASVICRSPERLEIHFRGKGFMGCKIFVIDKKGGRMEYIPYEDYARALRSSEIKHRNLDREMVSGVRSYNLYRE